jgi:hypothetical protein
LAIGIPADRSPEHALADNQKYKIVWQVAQALRAHDERSNEAAGERNRPLDGSLGSQDPLVVADAGMTGGRFGRSPRDGVRPCSGSIHSASLTPM